MLLEPPFATGHPTVWAAAASTRPGAPVNRREGGEMEWAAMPAKSASDSSLPSSPRVRYSAGRIERTPNFRKGTGWRGGRNGKPSRCGASESQLFTSGPTRRRQPRRSPRPSPVSSIERRSGAARSPPRAWAACTSGSNHSSPCAASGRLAKNGDARPSGCTAEQTSWRKPGSVSSEVRAPPPGSSAASTTRTLRPASARVMAAASPLGPAPTMTASCSAIRQRATAGAPTARTAAAASSTACPASSNRRPMPKNPWSMPS